MMLCLELATWAHATELQALARIGMNLGAVDKTYFVRCVLLRFRFQRLQVSLRSCLLVPCV